MSNNNDITETINPFITDATRKFFTNIYTFYICIGVIPKILYEHATLKIRYIKAKNHISFFPKSDSDITYRMTLQDSRCSYVVDYKKVC